MSPVVAGVGLAGGGDEWPAGVPVADALSAADGESVGRPVAGWPAAGGCVGPRQLVTASTAQTAIDIDNRRELMPFATRPTARWFHTLVGYADIDVARRGGGRALVGSPAPWATRAYGGGARSEVGGLKRVWVGVVDDVLLGDRNVGTPVRSEECSSTGCGRPPWLSVPSMPTITLTASIRIRRLDGTDMPGGTRWRTWTGRFAGSVDEDGVFRGFGP